MISPRLAPEQQVHLPHDDRGPLVLGIHWGLTMLATIFLGLRIYCKRITHLRLWWDDRILIAAWLIILATDGLTTVLVMDFKLGRHSWDLNIYDLPKFIIIINSRATTTLTSMGWTKTAFGVTLLRLTTNWTRKFVWFIIISLNVTTAISAAIPWIQCQPLNKAWLGDSIPGSCWAPGVGTKIWIALGAYSALMDFTLAVLPWTFLHKMQLQKREKTGILIAMSMGIVAGAVAIAKCAKLPMLGSGDTYNEVELHIWDVTESTVTIMAACIPTLRVLVRGMRRIREPEYTPSDMSFFFELSEGTARASKEVGVEVHDPLRRETSG
ncbi:hypothetical protein C7999DRAFT_35391 [Corynascus novoguineensis]|uniref:Rhodopsin domain-containing protein n=1 Tax=Corynascus novoguineensis TaxID=1126955 RepID=A0AAN7CM17_9PEZI|nr:hypothetical protein C7999DRAFT_35391 [Corynascus novoguineensis]